jgi:hypothetical protein
VFTHLLLGSACVGLFAGTGANPVVVPQNTAAKYPLKPPLYLGQLAGRDSSSFM